MSAFAHRFVGPLLAHGTELDASDVALMIPGLECAQVLAAMRSLESAKRLRRANERVVQYQRGIALAALRGEGDKASADMMSLYASRQLWNARVDPRRRTYAAGIYTHLHDRWGSVYDQPIVLNERQAGVSIEGVEQYNRTEDRIRLSLLAVDTHGFTCNDTGEAPGVRPVPAPARLVAAQAPPAQALHHPGRTGSRYRPPGVAARH